MESGHSTNESNGSRAGGRGIGRFLVSLFLPSGSSFFRYAERNFGVSEGAEYTGPPADDPARIAAISERLQRLEESRRITKSDPE